MNWKQHLGVGMSFGIIFLLLFYKSLTPQQWSIGIFISFIFSLLPDIDCQSSKLTWWLLITYTGLNLFFLLFAKEYLKFTIIAQFVTIVFNKMPHRGFIHSITACVLFSIMLFLLLDNLIFVGVGALSYWSHLLADGIPFKMTGNI